MKHIMTSIKPEYVCKILNKEKLLEIRKSIPKCILNGEECIVEIYCTKGKDLWMHNKETIILGNTNLTSYCLNGKVVAEFTLNSINKFDIQGLEFYGMKDIIKEQSCLDDIQLSDYLQNKVGYAWHIDDLKIYDKPKELAEFGLKRPPQSWCYIEGERK